MSKSNELSGSMNRSGSASGGGAETEAADKEYELKRCAYKNIFLGYKGGMDGRNEWDDTSHVKQAIRKLKLSLKVNDTIGTQIISNQLNKI
jgi:hypothetical protein